MDARLLASELICDPARPKHAICRFGCINGRGHGKAERTGSPIYYLDLTGKAIPLGKDLDLARIKWAELEAKEKPIDLRTMKGIFDRYIRDIVSKKAPRTQKDNLSEIKQLRPMFDSAPITPLPQP